MFDGLVSFKFCHEIFCPNGVENSKKGATGCRSIVQILIPSSAFLFSSRRWRATKSMLQLITTASAFLFSLSDGRRSSRDFFAVQQYGRRAFVTRSPAFQKNVRTMYEDAASTPVGKISVTLLWLIVCAAAFGSPPLWLFLFTFLFISLDS